MLSAPNTLFKNAGKEHFGNYLDCGDASIGVYVHPN